MRPSGKGSVSRIEASHHFELSQATTSKGYRTVSISFGNGRARPVGVHQLVADAFHGPCPDGLQVRHLNGIPSDNRPANLAYGNALQNAMDRKRHGTYLGGSNHHNAKLSGGQAAEIRHKRRLGAKVNALAEEYGVSVSTIESVIYGKSYKAS
ncbi:HNH endonuclease [Halomonas shantousis]